MKLNADLTLRASANINDLAWEDSPSVGVQRRRLEQDDDKPPVERVTTVVRFAAKSAFSSHKHTGGEEFLVLEGVFSDQHSDYPAGYYVRNPVGSAHTPHSELGCTIFVKLWQMRPDDQQAVVINTRDEALWQSTNDDGKMLALFSADYESVCMQKWPSGYSTDELEFEAGVEYLVISGRFSDQHGRYSTGSWLRLPAGSKQSIQVHEDCLLLRKTGHLRQPILYA